MNMTVWVLVAWVGAAGAGPVTIDNISSEKECERLARELTDRQRKADRSTLHECLKVEKTVR